MNWKSTIAAYFTFSRKDRIGIITLVLLIIIVYALPYLAPTKTDPPIILDDSLSAWVDSTHQVRVAGYSAPTRNEDFDYTPAPSTPEPSFEKGVLFPFDPNTLDAAGWKRLGLQDRTIRTLLNYRNKGGKFYKKEDLSKIWGLPKGFYERVHAYISIKRNISDFPINEAALKERKEAKNTAYKIDINSADTTEWKALPGIGSKLAVRIVNFRNKLGGFISVEQVRETYGLPDSTYSTIVQKLQLGNSELNKIKINTATKDELSAHPYISWNLAKAIVAYRQQHGTISSRKDLEKLMLLNEKELERLLPYLQFD